MNKQTNTSNRSVQLRFIKATFIAGLLPTLFLMLGLQSIRAGSATWKSDVSDYTWQIATNWTPETVPNGPSDIATFAVSNQTTVYVTGQGTGDVEVNSIVLNPGASAFTIGLPAHADAKKLTISGSGIINNSGILQSFVAGGPRIGGATETSTLLFTNSATAGNLTQLIAESGTNDEEFDGAIEFFDNSNAGSSVITVYGSGEFSDGGLSFYGSSSAGSATISVNPSYSSAGTVGFRDTSSAGSARITNQPGGFTVFQDFSDAANSTIMCGGGAYVDFYPGATAGNAFITLNGASEGNESKDRLKIYSGATAGNATIIGNGSSVGDGAYLELDGNGGTARLEIFGNGTLHLELHVLPGITIGSLEGDGLVLLGTNNLTVGSNNLSTTFSGIIDGAGSLRKVGRGQLTLSGRNTYTGGTTVSDGTLLLEINGNSSQTGTGKVLVTAGTIGGNGLVDGPLTIGNGRGRRATLSPSLGDIGARILKKLTFNSDGDYNWQTNSTDLTTSTVWAKGAKIASGAQFLASDIGTVTIPVGTVLTVISNFATTPISGTFSNLPDGGTVTIGRNTFQANYEGGDGNDLTLTVVP